MKSWLEKMQQKDYSTNNDGKAALAEKFIRTLKNKYSNTYHITIKTKPVDVKRRVYLDFNKQNNKENFKFIVGENVRISKQKNIFENY